MAPTSRSSTSRQVSLNATNGRASLRLCGPYVSGVYAGPKSIRHRLFDIVSQPYSLNFVPDCREVFAQVTRVLRPGGLYSFWAANPFASVLGTHAWNGTAYEIDSLYEQG